MGKILLFFNSKENGRLVNESIAQTHEVIIAEDEADLERDFDLAIIDGIALHKYASAIEACKQAAHPFFLPVLLITPRQDVGLATRHLWKTIDDLVLTPIERVELSASIEILMRARHQSFELGEVNARLRSEIDQRQSIEKMLGANLAQAEELYRVSQNLTMAFTPQELLDVFTQINFLQPICYASILSFGKISERISPSEYEVLATFPTPIEGAQETSPGENRQDFPFSFVTHKPLIIGNIDNDPRFAALTDNTIKTTPTKCVMLLPLMTRGEWFALLQLHADTPNQWTDDTLAQLGSLVEQLAVELNNYLLFQAETKARQRAEEADLLKSRFLAIVSHELRTPLIPIRQFSSLIVREITTNRKVMEYTGIIHQQVDNLYDLVGQLLDFVQIENAQFSVEAAAVQLEEIIHFARAQLTTITENHELVFNIPPDLPLLWVDLKRIAQVLVNLVSNAAKYSPADTPITLTASASDGFVQIDIADRGAGIPQKSRLMVFEAFARLKDTALKPGLGLGLAICKGIVEAHQGQIWIQDQGADTVGTTFSLTLPIAREDKLLPQSMAE